MRINQEKVVHTLGRTGSDNPLDKFAEQICELLEKNGSMNVRDLFDSLRASDPSICASEVAETVWRLAGRRLVEFEGDSSSSKSLKEYLGRWELNLWLYATSLIMSASVASIYMLPTGSSATIIRWMLGSILVLIVPGYVTTEALFPKFGQMESLERLAWSIGLSIAIVPFVALTLHFTPWGISLTPILISLCCFTTLTALVALARKYTLANIIAQNTRRA